MPVSLIFGSDLHFKMTSLVAQMVKHLPTMQETNPALNQSLGQEVPLE